MLQNNLPGISLTQETSNDLSLESFCATRRASTQRQDSLIQSTKQVLREKAEKD